MILKTIIKPTVLEGSGTTKQAMSLLRDNLNYIPAHLSYGTIGNAYTAYNYVYAYNIEVYKRKKHKDNPHFKVFVYKISQDWFYANKKKIHQYPRYFRIVDSKSHIGKLSAR